MYWQLSVVAVAVFWLLHRAYTLATTPVHDIVKTLNLDIPRAVTLSVDNITDTTVTLHWDKPTDANERKITGFVIYINGRRAAAINGRDLHCCIHNLNPSTKYRVDLVTLNHKGYKAKSRPVFIKTKSTELQNKAQTILLENPESLIKLLTDNSDLSVEKLTSVAAASTAIQTHLGDNLASPAPGVRLNGRSRSNTVNSTMDNGSMAVPSINLLPDPKSIEDIEELRYYLESGQEELHTVLNQQRQALMEFKEQEAQLYEEREKLRERKRLEDGNRQSMKSEIKMLDDSRRLNELKKSKQEAALATKRKAIEKMLADMEEWSRKTEEFDNDKTNIEGSEARVHSELDMDVETKKLKVKELQASIATLEDSIRQLSSQKKQVEQNKPLIFKVFETIRAHTDKKGLLDSEAVQNLELLKSIDLNLWEKINSEIETDAKLEAHWRAEQQREAKHCTMVSNQHTALLNEYQLLKSGGSAPDSNTSATLASPQLQPTLLSAGSTLQFPSMQASTTNSANSSFINSAFFSDSASPPPTNASLPTQSQTQPQPTLIKSNLWSSNGLSLNYEPTTRLSLSTNFRNDFLASEELDSPSMGHYLPTNLIGEELNVFNFPSTGLEDPGTGTGSDGIGSGQSSTPKNTPASLIPGSTVPSFNKNLHFPAETFSSNVSNRSIFHNEFGMGSQPIRTSLDNTSSPPQSFQNEFLSAQNSPAANHNDIASIFSGGTADMLTSLTQTSAVENKPMPQKSAFSPRRLSNVFGFGNKNKNSGSTGDAGSAPLKHSKFFSRGNNESVPANNAPLFKFDQETNNTGSFNILDQVWSGSPFQNSHSRDVSVESAGSHLESDEKSWSNFHQENNPDIKHLGIPSSADSVSSQAVSDVNGSTDLGPVVQLTNTNKSAAGTVQSAKSTKSTDSPNTTSSPGLFRRKSLFTFGNHGNANRNQNNAEKSPVKQSAQIARTYSPTKIDSHDDGDVEDYTPTTSSSNTPMRLFSRRKSSNNNMRKQSNSSHETESQGLDQHSIQSSSTTNSRKIVRKLSLFGKSNNSAANASKENTLDEQANEDDN